MSANRVPKCGRRFVKFDDVTIYPVLVVARTAEVDENCVLYCCLLSRDVLPIRLKLFMQPF